jgi:hypothetical protein
MHPKSFARLRVFIDFGVKLTNPPKDEKINLRIVACFSLRFETAHLTTIHHESTTSSPQKHHQKKARFPKPPSKMAGNGQKKPRPPPELFYPESPTFRR